MKFSYFKILFITLYLFNILFSKNITISGDILDAENGEPIPYANIVILDTNLGTSSDIDGYFILPQVPINEHLELKIYSMRIMVIGYEIFDKKINVTNKNIKLKINLKKSYISLDEIHISAERTRFEEKVEISTINLSNRDIRRIPAFIESDLFRTIQFLPSVSSANDFNAALIVRGGSPDENMILLDGAEIYNPYHIGGIFSTFNSDMISDSEFIAGGFSARYGGKLSSVLNITSRKGDSKNGRLNYKYKKYFDFSKANGEINALSSKVLAEGALLNGSWMFSARRTYFDKLIDLYYYFQDGESPFKYYFWDIHFKALIEINYNNQLSYSQFAGKDDLEINLDSDNFPGINFAWDWKNSTKILTWKYIPNSNYFMETNISNTKYLFNVDFQIRFQSNEEQNENDVSEDEEIESEENENPDLTFDINNIVEDISINQTIHFFPSDKYKGKIGWEYKILPMSYIERFGDNEITRLESNSNIISFFSENIFNPFPNFRFNVGTRFSLFSSYRDLIGDPRIGIKYNPISDLALKASWGQYSQFLYTINKDDELLRIVDFWQPIPDNKKPQQSEHYILGAEYWISEGNIFSIETYYKPYINIYDLNPTIDNSNISESIAISGIGEAYGIELLYRLNKNKFSGWISYAYSSIQREVDLNSDGIIWEEQEIYPAKYDKPHSFSTVISYNINSLYDISISTVISSGQTYTPVVGKVYNTSLGGGENSSEQPYANFGNIYGSKNGSRYPSYFRIDLSLSRIGKLFGLNGKYKFQIINLTNHYNVLLYNWNHNASPSQVSAYSMFPIFLSFGWEFKI